jgi:iron complex outermembrane receptor protein
VPLAPKWMASLGVQYTKGPFYAELMGKRTGEQYTNFTNTETVDPYTVWNFSSAYEFESGGFLKHPKLQFNVVNLFDKDYIYADKFTVSKNASFYQGGPRFSSVTFSTDF